MRDGAAPSLSVALAWEEPGGEGGKAALISIGFGGILYIVLIRKVLFLT